MWGMENTNSLLMSVQTGSATMELILEKQTNKDKKQTNKKTKQIKHGRMV